ncbi:MAG: GGDEF domain-containing protein [Candidatus Obscuribacterales bacterium]|nr:GGDEF domain-containing protein [Candidatus Obscuribacterales bacterium]
MPLYLVFLCRWEEDEIVVVVKDSADVFVPLLSNALLDFALLDVPIVKRSIRLNAGVASYPNDGDTIDEILDIARWRVHNARGSDQGICLQ